MYQYKVKEVLRVVDGDTLDLLIDLGFDLTLKQRVRLLYVDTPELRSRDLEEKVAARAAKVFVEEVVKDSDITVNTTKADSFGRYLAEIFVNGQSLNQRLLDEGFAKKYGT